jgi:hypothetical protein
VDWRERAAIVLSISPKTLTQKLIYPRNIRKRKSGKYWRIFFLHYLYPIFIPKTITLQNLAITVRNSFIYSKMRKAHNFGHTTQNAEGASILASPDESGKFLGL